MNTIYSTLKREVTKEEETGGIAMCDITPFLYTIIIRHYLC